MSRPFHCVVVVFDVVLLRLLVQCCVAEVVGVLCCSLLVTCVGGAVCRVGLAVLRGVAQCIQLLSSFFFQRGMYFL